MVTNKMKICYIGNANSIHTQRFAKWFADEGHEVHLICPTLYKNNNDGVYFKNVQLHQLKLISIRLPSNLLFYTFQVKKIIKNINPDVLHAHYITYDGLIGALTGFHPFIITPWGRDILIAPDKNLISKFFIKYALKKADAVSSINDNIKPKLIELKCSENKIVPLRIATVDTKEFHPNKKSKTIRKHIGCENGFLVINTRSSHPIYHLDVFIKAVPLVLNEMQNVKFIVFLWPSESANYKITELIEKLNVEKNVICIKAVAHSKMPGYLASSDLYVDSMVSPNAMMDASFTNENTGIGTTTLEAMSCGTPVLIANKNNIEKYSYRTYYPLDSQDLAKKIVYLLKNEDLRKQLKAQAREFACTADMNMHMKKWETLYSDLKNKKST